MLQSNEGKSKFSTGKNDNFDSERNLISPKNIKSDHETIRHQKSENERSSGNDKEKSQFKKKLQIKIEDEGLNNYPMITPSNQTGNVFFGTHSTLQNFIETPTNQMLVQANQRLTPGMRQMVANASKDSSLGSLNMKKRKGNSSVRTSSDRDTQNNQIYPYIQSAENLMTPNNKFFPAHGSLMRGNLEKVDDDQIELGGPLDTYEEIQIDNRSIFMKLLCPLNDERLMISGKSKFKTRWDITIILLSLFAVFLTPVQVAFNPPDFNNLSYRVLMWVIDSLFAIDVFLSFRTTIIEDISQVEITDAKVIAKKYVLNGRFIIDLVSCIPFDSFIDTHSDKLKLISILKLARLFRFTKVISYLNATENVKLSLKLFKLIFYLIIYLHLQACAWYFYTKQDRSWFPLTDIIQKFTDFYDHPVYYTYCFSVWHSTSIMAGADMVPANAHQAIVTSLLLLSSSFIDGSILGTISVIVQSMNRKSTKLQEQLEFATSTMKNIKLPQDIQHTIIEYLNIKQNDQDSQQEVESLMKLISPSLRHRVTQHLFYSIIMKMKVFEDIPEAIEFVVQNIEVQVYQPEEYIIKQGQKAQQMYFLAQGECEVLVKDQTKKESFVRDIFSGQMFGEIALLFNTKRTSSVKSKNQCTVGALNEAQFYDLIQSYPEIEQRMLYETRKYDDHWKMFQIHTLGQVEYFQQIPYSVREEIHYKLSVENYEKGAKIFTRGQECENIYFLINGSIELVVNRDNQDYVLDVLIPGSHIGAFSIINETPFQFTGKAKTNISLLMLSRENLFGIAEQSDFVSFAIEEATKYIIDNEVPLCDYFFMNADNQRIDVSKGIHHLYQEIQNSGKVDQQNPAHSKSIYNPNETMHLKNLHKQGSANMKSFNKNQLLINPLRDHRALIDLKRRFKNGVRRLIVLNKGKEQKKIKIIELINFIRAQKKIQQNNDTMNFGGLLEVQQTVPIPQRRASNNVQFAFQNTPARKQSNATIRKISQATFNTLGDPFYSQQPDSSTLDKMNKKLDKLVSLIQIQQTDILSIKLSLNLKTEHISTSPLRDSREIFNDKEAVLKTQMTGIVEEDAENSYKSSASVSIGSQNKGNYLSPEFINHEGGQDHADLKIKLPQFDLKIPAGSITRKSTDQLSKHTQLTINQRSPIDQQIEKTSQMSFPRIEQRSPVPLPQMRKSQQKYSSNLLSTLNGDFQNQPVTGNINQGIKPSPMQLMVERFIQSKVTTREDHFMTLKQAVSMAISQNIISMQAHQQKKDSSLMSSSLNKSSQKSVDFGGSPPNIQKSQQAIQIQKLTTSLQPHQLQSQEQKQQLQPLPISPQKVNPIISALPSKLQESQVNIIPDLVPKSPPQLSQPQQQELINSQVNTSQNQQPIKKINTEYVQQVMSMIKSKQKFINMSQSVIQPQQQQPPTFAQINERDISNEDVSHESSNILTAQASRQFIMNQAAKNIGQQNQTNKTFENQSNINKLTIIQEEIKKSDMVPITGTIIGSENKSRNYTINGRDQQSVDNSAFEIIDGRMMTNHHPGFGIDQSRESYTHSQLEDRRNGMRLENVSGAASRIFNTSEDISKIMLVGGKDKSGDILLQEAPKTEYYNPAMQKVENVRRSKIKLVERDQPVPEFRDSMSPVQNRRSQLREYEGQHQTWKLNPTSGAACRTAIITEYQRKPSQGQGSASVNAEQ